MQYDIPPTMPALQGGLGPNWVTNTVAVPVPPPGFLLVRVMAAGLNRADQYMLEGNYLASGGAFTAGLELAGEVVSVGENVDRFMPGERVMGVTLGSFAPFALVDARSVVAVPASLPWIDAGALPVGLSTEYDAVVTQAGLESGQSVLIVGGTTGVGLIGIQLAKALGASPVIATTTSGQKAIALTDAGADVVIDTTAQNLTEAVLAATDGRGADIVLDHIGGEHFADLPSATALQGTIVNIGRIAGPTATIDLDQLSFRRLRLIGTTFSARSADEIGEVYSTLAREALALVESGAVRPVIDSVHAFDAAADAAERLRSNGTAGKVVLDLSTVPAVEEGS
jgi:NADPH:quinone reductase-like Zn-dependent oxidoreductase